MSTQTNSTNGTGRKSDFEARVFTIVNAIPAGFVATYGQLALLAGRPGCARHAGRVLRFAPEQIPCHRVVNSTGHTAPGWPEQRLLLQQENVCFRSNGCVDMKHHRWHPEY